MWNWLFLCNTTCRPLRSSVITECQMHLPAHHRASPLLFPSRLPTDRSRALFVHEASCADHSHWRWTSSCVAVEYSVNFFTLFPGFPDAYFLLCSSRHYRMPFDERKIKGTILAYGGWCIWVPLKTKRQHEDWNVEVNLGNPIIALCWKISAASDDTYSLSLRDGPWIQLDRDYISPLGSESQCRSLKMFLHKRTILLSLLQPQPEPRDQVGGWMVDDVLNVHFSLGIFSFRFPCFWENTVYLVVEAVYKCYFKVISHWLRGAKLHLDSKSLHMNQHHG